MKIKEQELTKILKGFEKQDVIIEFYNLFQARIEFIKTHITYNQKNGFLHIYHSTNNNRIDINITSVRTINLKNNILYFSLDNYIEFKLFKK